MDKILFGINVFMGVLSLIALVWIKTLEHKLGKVHRVIKVKKKLNDKIIYIMGYYLILSKVYKIIAGLVKSNLDMYLIIECLSTILVAIMLIYITDVKIKISDKGMSCKLQVLKKEDLVDVKSIENTIEVTYKMNTSFNTIKMIPEKENSEEIVTYLKEHFNIK